VIVGACKQVERRTPPPLQRFKLHKLRITLQGPHALPLILTSADIQRITISNSSWYCHTFIILISNLHHCTIAPSLEYHDGPFLVAMLTYSILYVLAYLLNVTIFKHTKLMDRQKINTLAP
jgi:hypothetical protein